MTIKRLDTDVKLPFDEVALLRGDPESLEAYMRKLVKKIQEELRDNAEITNLGIDVTDGTAIYLGLKNASGIYPIGTFRWIKVNSSVELQEKLTITGVEDDDWEKVASHSR